MRGAFNSIDTKWGKVMLVIFALAIATIVYTQWAQARRLGVVKAVKINHEGEASTTLEPITGICCSDSDDGTVTVTQESHQSGNGEVNESSSDVDISDDGDSIRITNRNRQRSSSGDVEVDGEGSASSGSQSNSGSSQTTVIKDGKVIYSSN